MRALMKVSAFPALFALLLLPACGCSVLTIDVDVYKGRLTHDPDIQTHQLISMTKTAKGVLRTLYRNVANRQPSQSDWDAFVEWQPSKDKRDREAREKFHDTFPDPERLFLIRINYLLEQFGPRLPEEPLDVAAGDPLRPRGRPTTWPTRQLDLVMETYLARAVEPTAAPEEEGLRETRRLLLNSLSFFGDSVRNIANVELFGAEIRARKGPQESNTFMNQIRPYILVLQAVGNSILVQVDEMRHRDNFEEGEGRRAEWQRRRLQT